MTMPTVIWGAPQWLAVALGLLGVAGVALLWSYSRARARPSVRLACAVLKGIGFAALAISLLEPLLSGTRPRSGANAFAVVADDSQSLQIRDQGDSHTRGEYLRELLASESDWKTRLGQDFDVRRYAFDSNLRAVDDFEELTFEGVGSSVGTSLGAIAKRFRGLPLAGVLLVTDGNRTDVGEIDWSELPPVYPVMPPARGVERDVSVDRVSVSQTNFESAPAVIRADVSAVGFSGQSIVLEVADEAGRVVERQEAVAGADGEPLSFRVQFRPEASGLNIYTVRAFAASDQRAHQPDADPTTTVEQTLANNSRLAIVDQGGGPYRVLYVSGRPNWEYKFLRRAIDDDKQVDLVGLLRIARRQPKFDFQAARSRSRTTSPLFDGFDLADEETAERYDEPVLIRIGTRDEVELRDGFPKVADDLYGYHAIILDDLEASFFTQDQLTLLRNFVSVRGGGFLMLGGPDSFVEGAYDRTPIGELLPVYLNRSEDAPGGTEYQLVLTREGWLQPWVRTRETEDSESKRLAEMPPFQSLNHAGPLKPGAVVLAEARDPQGDETAPALVAQQFGQGKSAALLIGDLWRWGIRRAEPAEDDFDRAWRQTVRWLVSDVPGRVDLDARAAPDATTPAVELRVRVRDPEYRPLDNARVSLQARLPDGGDLTLDAAPDDREAGAYTATYVTRQPGAYRFTAKATGPDGSAVGEAVAGWAAEPAADEFARLAPDREFLEQIARATGGEVVDSRQLGAFVSSLSRRDVPITEPWTSPLWHQPIYFLVAITCLTAEWGLRRVNGLA